ncbi:alpha/beta fold hydrolase [Paenibacillus oryzisoli]|uniref:acetylxylan esterase n=1 Tax=Paenibacillus oryzisoli TaxID=1850517 RepID=UPI003D298AED
MNAVRERIGALEQIVTPLTANADFNTYWAEELRTVRERELGGSRVETKSLMPTVKAYRVQFYGADHTPLYGWFLVPDRPGGTDSKLPCAVKFHGYTGNKGFPEEHADLLMMGMAVFSVDVRGQGGESGNLLPQTFGMATGWVSQGICAKEESYYRAVVLDAVRAIDWVSEQPEVDPLRIAAVGSSQGGGLVLLATALNDNVAAAVALVPNMCRMDWGIMHSVGSVSEVGKLASFYPEKLDDMLDTLSYFDAVNFAERITVPILVSANLKDMICWPETIFAAYNRIASEDKQRLVDPFIGHQVSSAQWQSALTFLAERLQPY